MTRPIAKGIVIVYDEIIDELRFFKYSNIKELDEMCATQPGVIFNSIDQYVEWCVNPTSIKVTLVWIPGTFDLSLYGPYLQSEVSWTVKTIVCDKFECVDKVYELNVGTVERSLKKLLSDLSEIFKFNSIKEYVERNKNVACPPPEE